MEKGGTLTDLADLATIGQSVRFLRKHGWWLHQWGKRGELVTLRIGRITYEGTTDTEVLLKACQAIDSLTGERRVEVKAATTPARRGKDHP